MTNRPRILLPLYAHPSADPAGWRAAAAFDGALTVVVDAAGPPDRALVEAVSGLTAAGAGVLGRVDLGFSTRPVADLLEEVRRWAGGPATGVFLDRAPTSPFCLGPVALAARAARRAGLANVLLNPGRPTDPAYRELGAAICSFEGPWQEYRRWSGDGSRPGDAHLVHSVPPGSLAAARARLRSRRAWGLVTDRRPPAAYAGAPAWLLPAPAAVG
jgi:hypothetical protein